MILQYGINFFVSFRIIIIACIRTRVVDAYAIFQDQPGAGFRPTTAMVRHTWGKYAPISCGMPRSSHTRTYRGSFYFFWRTRIFLITFDHRHHRTHNNYIITLFRPARAATATLETLIKILKPQNAGGKKHNEYTRWRSCKGSRG